MNTRTTGMRSLVLGLAVGAALSAGLPAHAQTVANNGFENPNENGNYLYNPSLADADFSFLGNSGIAGVNSGFGNTNSSDQTQVAFLQTISGGGSSSISQSISGFTSGQSYSISFDAAQRGSNGRQSVTVSLFGTSYTLMPVGLLYDHYTIGNVTATSDTGTLAFTGAQAGDNTAFLDNIAIGSAVSASITNGNFEGYRIGDGQNDYLSSQFFGPSTVGEWSYQGTKPGPGAGLVNGNGGGFSPPLASGSQASFLQNTGGSLSQLVAGFSAGTIYTLNFSAAPRTNDGNDFEVLLDPTFDASGTVTNTGTLLGTFLPTDNGVFTPFQSASFTTTPGNHVLAFYGLGTAPGDHTSFIDDVSLSAVAAPEPSQFVGLGLGALGLSLLGLKARKRTGAASQL